MRKILGYSAVLVAFALILAAVSATAQVVSTHSNGIEQILRPWILWLLLAAVCIIVEMFTASFFIFWFGVGGAGAALLAALGFSAAWQWAGFIIISTICLLFSRRFAERITRGQRKKVGPDRLIDQAGIVLEIINPDAGKGKVRVESEEWRAISAEGEVIEVGARVQVLRVEGTHLIVQRRKV